MQVWSSDQALVSCLRRAGTPSLRCWKCRCVTVRRSAIGKCLWHCPYQGCNTKRSTGRIPVFPGILVFWYFPTYFSFEPESQRHKWGRLTAAEGSAPASSASPAQKSICLAEYQTPEFPRYCATLACIDYIALFFEVGCARGDFCRQPDSVFCE